MKIRDICDEKEMARIIRLELYAPKNLLIDEDIRIAQAISNLEVKLTLDYDKVFEIIYNKMDKESRIWIDETAQALKSKAGEIIVRKE